MSRLDDLPENHLFTTLSETEKLANELKNRQLVSGGNVRFYMSDSGDQYDYEGTLEQGPQAFGYGGRFFRVTATAKNMDNLFADIILEVYNGAGQRYTVSDYLNAIQNGGVQISALQYEEPSDPADSNKRVWVVGANGTTNAAVKYKWYVVASDEVTITKEMLN